MADEPWVCHIAFGNKTPPCRRELSHIFCQTMNNMHRVYLDEEAARARQEQRLASLKRPGLKCKGPGCTNRRPAPSGRRGRPPVYCSDECKRAGIREINRINRRKKKVNDRITRAPERRTA